jgi:hypothetical protein
MKINRSSLGACNCADSYRITGLGACVTQQPENPGDMVAQVCQPMPGPCDDMQYPTDYNETMSLTPAEHAKYLACKRSYKLAEESTIRTDDPSQRKYAKQWADLGVGSAYADILTPLNSVTKPMEATLDESGTNLFAVPSTDEAKRAQWSDWLLAVSVLSLLYSLNRGK